MIRCFNRFSNIICKSNTPSQFFSYIISIFFLSFLNLKNHRILPIETRRYHDNR
ncbi:hypothetical protein SB48_HM08orf01564 [Heyndrickxia coagulans]|uniref:Uncharacterized protein n=1 Tax=Heyndrickxia coagulans TaxID=1398 RepID=A0AAN0T3T1_HEYCO|nr:hypothetical protein SB48_HM08orf01564 [Heyndrickxia coagulans]